MSWDDSGSGVTTAYDVGAPGAATLDYENRSSRTLWLVLLAVLWASWSLAASRLAVPGRFRIAVRSDETLIDLDAEPGADPPPPGGRDRVRRHLRRRRGAGQAAGDGIDSPGPAGPGAVILRRLPILAVTVVGLGACWWRWMQEPVEATFAPVPGPWMPAASPAGALTSTWFCSGACRPAAKPTSRKLRRGERRRECDDGVV